jgi:hypothetical protein
MLRNRIALVIAASVLSCPAARAQLTIVPIYDSSITSDPNSATIQATINQVIQEYHTRFSNPITVNITFQEMSGGLGSSSTFSSTISYQQYRNALVSHATTANDTLALSHLPNTTNNPVNGDPNIDVSTANLRALGINVNPGSDSTIGLNTSIMNLSRSGTKDPNKYDLYSVAAHEINEALGFGSNLDFGGGSGPVRPQDLFRYDQNGARSYTRDSSAQAYFSLDGPTKLARFNQDSTGDFGDWYSPGGQTPQVQDAFGTPGAAPDLGVELTQLDVIGYSLVPVPEPGGVLAIAAAGLAVGWAARRRRPLRGRSAAGPAV